MVSPEVNLKSEATKSPSLGAGYFAAGEAAARRIEKANAAACCIMEGRLSKGDPGVKRQSGE
jgi:hypothetical protein